MSEAITSIPSANILLSSLRSVGYTPETAIADIVDNSLSANASIVSIEFNWQEQSIIVSDNGEGMSNQGLLKAMNIGSADPLDSRSIHDLGRFGMGLKTASFSLGKKLTVLAKVGENINNASWDLDYVRKNDKWQILVEDSLRSAPEVYGLPADFTPCGISVCAVFSDSISAAARELQPRSSI